MDKQILSNFYFDKYYIKSFRFNLNKDFKKEKVKINIETEILTGIDPDKNVGHTTIKMSIWDEIEKGNKPFSINVSIVGYFSADDNMETDKFTEMCEYNGAAILFPFLRSAVVDITKIANVSPLVLPLINIKKFIREQKSSQEE